MKKIISLVIALIMLQTTALANTTEGFAQLWENYSNLQSFKGETTMSVIINEPLLILEDIPLDDDGIDYPLMINALLSSTATADYSVSISEDYKKMQMAMSIAYDVPISLNEDFKLEAWTRMGMWLDYDMTNPEAPVYKMIMKMPFESKYQVFDMSAEARSIEKIMTPTTIETISNAMLKTIEVCGEIREINNGYCVKIDNEGFIGYIMQVFTIAGALASDKESKRVLDEMATFMREFSPEVTILGDDGMTLEYTKNAKGDVVATVEAIHFDFNLYDIATLLGLDTEGLIREHADINITFKAETEISGHNTTVAEIPELTEENSININTNDYNSNLKYYYLEAAPVFANNCVYYPIDEIATTLGNDFAYEYANGALMLKNAKGNIITVSDSTITMDDEMWEFIEPQITDIVGKVYITDNVLGFLGVTYVSADYNLDTKQFGVEMFYDITNISYPYIEEEITQEEPYIPPYLYEYVSSDQVPHIEDGEVFIPVYDLFQTMYQGEFVITADSLRYTATKDNYYGIGEVFVKVGENSIMVDDEYITFEKPVVNVANIFRAPIELVENLGFTVDNIYVGNYGTSYSLSMPNPEYAAE